MPSREGWKNLVETEFRTAYVYVRDTFAEQMALSLNGKKRNLHRNDFLRYADNIRLSKEAASKMLRLISSLKVDYLELCEESYLPPEMKERFSQLIEDRIAVL